MYQVFNGLQQKDSRVLKSLLVFLFLVFFILLVFLPTFLPSYNCFDLTLMPREVAMISFLQVVGCSFLGFLGVVNFGAFHEGVGVDCENIWD